MEMEDEILSLLDIEDDGLSPEFESQEKCAQKLQQEFLELFGYRDKIVWDCYERCDRAALETKIRLTFQINDDVVSEKKALQLIDKIIDAIWNQRKYGGGKLFMSPIFVLTANYKTYKGNIRNAQYSKHYELHPVFRIRKCTKNDDSDVDCCMIFIDEHARVYSNWKDFLGRNKLPKAILMAPKNGIYMRGQMGHVLLDFVTTPACGIIQMITDSVNIGSAVVGLGSAGVLVASAITTAVAPPVALGALAVGAVCSSYSVVQSGIALVDRATHEQSISLADADARGSWVGIAGGISGLAAAGATNGLAMIARNGQNVGRAIQSSVDIINAAAIATNGAGVLHGICGIALKIKDNEKIHTMDAVQLGASLFLLTHSIYNFQTARNIIRSSQNATIAEFRGKLTEMQQSQFDALVNDKINVHGEMIGKNEVIRSLKTIPENQSFADWNNKNVDKEVACIAFKDGNAVMGNSTAIMDPNQPNNNPLLENHKSFLIDFVVDPRTFANMIRSIGRLFHIQNVNDLKTAIINCLESLTIKAYNSFMEMTNEFIVIYGENIQKQINRIIPYELFLSDIFKLLNVKAEKEGVQLSKFIQRTIRPKVYGFIIQFYKQFRPNLDTIINCKVCSGVYYNSVDALV